MQDRSPSARSLFKAVEDGLACSPTMDRHNPPTNVLALSQNMLEYAHLILPRIAKLWGTIESDLTDVAHLGQKRVEQCKLTFSFACQLRMQAERRTNAGRP